MKCPRRLLLVQLAVGLAMAVATAAGAEAPGKLVLAHYMPWYASKPVSGDWGWHWTMNHFNPETLRGDGTREIASHDAPIIGPYDSGDDHALECQVLLMKFAGIDGVVIDWYGIADFRDYAVLHTNTQRLITHAKRAGLRFAICYEDQSVRHMVDGGRLPESEVVAEGARAMTWLARHCFSDPAYVTLDGRPVLMIFGPRYFSGAQWSAIRSGTSNPPWLFGLPHLSRSAGLDGAFGWPPVSGGKEIPREAWLAYLEQLCSHERSIPVVFPGFHDIYREAGLHDSYGFIDSRGGNTCKETLSLALEGRSQIVQIATWNDYGEGTVIEPTMQNGYRYLEMVQAALPTQGAFTPEDLRLPVKLYTLRKQVAGDATLTARLQNVSDLLFAGNCAEARALLDSAP